MQLNQIDFGSGHPWPSPEVGVATAQSIVEGLYTSVYQRAGNPRRLVVTFWAKAWQAIGGNAAGTQAALKYLLKQGEELASNAEQMPCFIRWAATADPAAALNADDTHDGWYVIESFKPDYTRLPSGFVPVQMIVVKIGNATVARQGMSYRGAALVTTYAGASQTWMAFPANASAQPATATSRSGGDGAIPLSIGTSTLVNPLPFVPSATVADWSHGGVRIFDTINSTTNPVPTSGNLVHANWVEVFGPDHRFEGDAFVTNGLLGLLFQSGQNRVCRVHLWNTSLAVSAWQLTSDVLYYDSGSTLGTNRGYTFLRVGAEELRILTNLSTSAGKWAELGVRLQRGQYFAWLDFRPLSEANSVVNGLTLNPVTQLKICYNSLAASDAATGPTSLGTPTDYGYVAGFTASAAQPFIVGALSQGAVTKMAPTNGSVVGFADTDGPAQNAVRTYGVFAFPYGASGTYSTANLQAEAESGTLPAPWQSVPDTSASGGNAARAISGSVAGPNNSFGTAFQPAPANYMIFFRVRSGTAGAGTNQEIGIRLRNATDGTDIQVKFLRPVDVTTTYAWFSTGVPIAMPAGKNVQFMCSIAATLSVDWYVDEACLVPVSGLGAYYSPQELWQQSMFARRAQLVRY